MSYADLTSYEQMLAAKSTGAATAANLAATAAQWVGYIALAPTQIRRIAFVVTAAVTAGTTAPVVALKRRPTIGSSSGAVTIAQMTIPAGAAIGSVYYKDVPQGPMVAGINTGLIGAGEELSYEVTVQAVDGGTATGAGYLRAQFDCPVDNAADQSKMILAT